MELPPLLRQGVDRALEGVPLSELASSAASLSLRYREEVRDGRMHLNNERAALAYLATRLPATYAATHASLAALAEALPGFAPATMLDAGAGPGTALWAAASLWPSLSDAVLIEASPAIRKWGEQLSASSGVSAVEWRATDVARPLASNAPRDLVTLCYVLDELAPDARQRLVSELWDQTSGALVVVEPGTTRGWQRILAVRDHLIAAGAHIAAPCPHPAACPLVAPDWCHFSARVARSRIHRLAKEADVPWEDEKFIYLAASRIPPANRTARVLAPPERASGRVRLKLCQSDGSATDRLVTRREGDGFKRARRVDWGDRFEG
jgi:ribosomal protein RSM22 (predicted rRNA methylase)